MIFLFKYKWVVGESNGYYQEKDKMLKKAALKKKKKKVCFYIFPSGYKKMSGITSLFTDYGWWTGTC